MKKKIIKISLITTAAIILTILVSASLFIYDIKIFSSKPNNENSTDNIVFNIRSGESLKKVSYNLKKNKIIDNPLKFKIFAKLKKYDKKIQAGEYILSPSMSPHEILRKFIKGKVNLYRLTIPEGYSISQIGDELEKRGICKKDEFLQKALSRKFTKSFSIPGKNLEGYLYPETYFFRKNSNPEMVIKKMVDNFFKIYGEKNKKRAKVLGLSDHEIITLASIIEKETGAAHERAIISSVFHNRLKKGMRLETDPTVIYGLKDFNGNITRKDLRKKTPYNTYIIKGLPPGPIANPGKESINAALYPKKTDFLFFVSKKDGTHYFSKTLKEHNRAVRKYQLGR